MALKLYYSPMSSATRVVWALEELGIPYEKVRIHLDKGEQRSPEFLAINPNGKVPALIDGDTKLFESLAILLHLGERYGVEKGLWPAPNTKARAEAISWTVWGTVELVACALNHVLHNTDLPFALPKEARSAHTIESSRQLWNSNLAVLNARLSSSAFTVGDQFTFADAGNASSVQLGHSMGGLPLDPYPAVARWLSTCLARPAFQRAIALT